MAPCVRFLWDLFFGGDLQIYMCKTSEYQGQQATSGESFDLYVLLVGPPRQLVVHGMKLDAELD